MTCNGEASKMASFCVELAPVLLSDKRYILSGCPNGGGDSSYRLQYSNWMDTAYNDIGSGKIIRAFDINEYPNVQFIIRIASGYTCNNLTFHPMIRLASIDDDTYEPYISDTELDVELPRLLTFCCTNTLSVRTTVQPSIIENKGIIKAIQEWSDQDES